MPTRPAPCASLLLAVLLAALGCPSGEDGTGGELFAEAVDYAVAPNPNGVVAADYDGDGVLDLAVSCSNDASGVGEVDLLLGQGDGTFVAGEVIGVAVPYSMETGDLDADGHPDIAAVSFDGQGPLGITILRGNGDGTFRKESLGGRDWRGLVALGDANEDGVADLAAPWADHETGTRGVEIALGPDLEERSVLDVDTSALALGDLDGDGHLDLASEAGVQRGDGDGGFGAPVELQRDEVPQRMTVADLDRDGIVDLIFSSKESLIYGSELPVVEVVLGDADAAFGPARSFPIVPYPQPVAAADLDGDGLLDLAVGCDDANLQHTDDRIGILLGDGTGGFPATAAVHVSLGSASDLVAADLDGDGDVDLVGTNTSGSSISVLLSNVAATSGQDP